MSITLYGYWRSSAAWRVRIALEWKNLPYETVPIHLARGEQASDTYRALNPQGLVPLLVDGKTRISQSLAIIEYLEETHPAPPLLPTGPAQRAEARALAQLVACDIHPLANLRVLKYLTGTLGQSEEAKNAWYRHWLLEGLSAMEQQIAAFKSNGRFCVGEALSIADLCLIPQLYNARRFNVPLDGVPTLVSIDAHCATLPAFEKALPENQPDAENQ